MRASGLGLAALLLLVGQAQAGPFNPNDFTSLGTLDLISPNTYTVNTDTLTLTGPGGVNFTGVLSNGIAVFDFSGITIDAGASLTATGSHPLALLSQSSATINGTINVNGGDGGFNSGNGGSGGGGGGGGAIEIGALGGMTITGMINANGGGGTLEAGGGIFLHGDSVLLSSSGLLIAVGGGTSNGGRVLVEFGSGGFTNPNPSAVDVAGGGETGGFGTPGGMGVFTSQPLAGPAAVPEPSSLVLLAIGGLTLAFAHRQRKNRHSPANP